MAPLVWATVAQSAGPTGEFETLPEVWTKASTPDLPALQTLSDTLWASNGREALTSPKTSAIPKPSLATMFLLIELAFHALVVGMGLRRSRRRSTQINL